VLQLTNIIEKGFFIDSAKSRILQLCDVCTLYARKGVEASSGFKATNALQAASDEAGAAKLAPIITVGSDPNFNDVVDWLRTAHAGKSSN